MAEDRAGVCAGLVTGEAMEVWPMVTVAWGRMEKEVGDHILKGLIGISRDFQWVAMECSEEDSGQIGRGGALFAGKRDQLP